jgi:two-component system, chemotaxis family, protein-glutamate methylesterase/glutaminase
MTPSIVVVGTSLGGLHALQLLLGGLPRGFAVPIVIVQHRGKHPDDALSRILSAHCMLAVHEPLDKDPIEPGHVYIAPADYHLLVERGSLALSTEAPVNYARPSIDVLFESAAESYGGGVVGIVLTGANHDGAAGASLIQQRGGRVLVQDPASAESRPMPLAALTATGVVPTPLDQIAAALVALC